MSDARAENSMGQQAKSSIPNRIMGSLKDALLAAGRDEGAQPGAHAGLKPSAAPPPVPMKPESEAAHPDPVVPAADSKAADTPVSPSAEEAARLARGEPAQYRLDAPVARVATHDGPPTTRVVRRDGGAKASVATTDATEPPRTVLVRGRKTIQRGTFESDPVVAFLVVIGGPGLGAFRPVFEGNNTVGRSTANRIVLDFGDDSISSDAQAYIRYDSSDRSFLFVPNLAKTNVVSVNEQRPTAAVPLAAMDILTFGRTQIAFVPFCGEDFDWSEIAEA
jgi:hypothetical protein